MNSFTLYGKPLAPSDIQEELLGIDNPWQHSIGDSCYLANLNDPNIISNIASNFSPAKVYTQSNLFSEDDCAWLYSYAFRHSETIRHNENGTIFMAGNFGKIVSKFSSLFEALVPGCLDSPSVSGNFFITPSQYGLHNDSTRKSDWLDSFNKNPEDNKLRRYVPWKNVIIPLWIGGQTQATSHGVWFRQRHIDFAHVYLNGSNRKISTTYPVVRDHSKIDFRLANGNIQNKEKTKYTFDKYVHSKYLYYTPIKRLEGLEPELITPWIPGCPIVFDSFQLHATNKGTNKIVDFDNLEKPNRLQWDNKMGLLVTFLREI